MVFFMFYKFIAQALPFILQIYIYIIKVSRVRDYGSILSRGVDCTLTKCESEYLFLYVMYIHSVPPDEGNH